MALYQMKAEMVIRKNSGLYQHGDVDFSDTDRCNLVVVQASTNNIGTGSASKAVRAGKDPKNGAIKSST